MTREEFESILEECFIEGYNSALEDIQEDILDEDYIDIEDDMDSYNEESGHERHILRQFPIGGIKHARSTDMGKRSAKELRKLGFNALDSKTIFKPGAEEALKNAKEKLEKSKKYQKFTRYVSKNANKLAQDLIDRNDRFEAGKLKDLKTKLHFNRAKNIANRLNELFKK